jgi:hypothetical protein
LGKLLPPCRFFFPGIHPRFVIGIVFSGGIGLIRGYGVLTAGIGFAVFNSVRKFRLLHPLINGNYIAAGEAYSRIAYFITLALRTSHIR